MWQKCLSERRLDEQQARADLIAAEKAAHVVLYPSLTYVQGGRDLLVRTSRCHELDDLLLS